MIAPVDCSDRARSFTLTRLPLLNITPRSLGSHLCIVLHAAVVSPAPYSQATLKSPSTGVSTPTGAGGSRPASAPVTARRNSTGGSSLAQSPYAHTQLQPNSGAVGGDSGASGPDVGGTGPHAPYAHTNLAAARSGSSPGLTDRSAGSSEGASPASSAPSPYAHTSLGESLEPYATSNVSFIERVWSDVNASAAFA